MSKNDGALDFHNTLMDVWSLLEHLKERMESNNIPERFILKLKEIQQEVADLDWDDDLVKLCNLELEGE